MLYDEVLDCYALTWKIIGTQGQHQAEIEHLEFLEDVYEIGDNKSKEIFELVHRLKLALEVQV